MVVGGLDQLRPIIQHWPRLGEKFGTDLWIVRDDLLPFPLAGNKVRKTEAELDSLSIPVNAVVTNGAIDSNHCRTVAMFAAQRGLRANIVLHGDEKSGSPALRLLHSLGAEFTVGPAETISSRIDAARASLESEGLVTHVIAGGGHSLAGAIAFRDAGIEVLEGAGFDQVFVASGTGATQGGLVAAAVQAAPETEIVGVSVARDAVRGKGPVAEAAAWAGAPGAAVTFLDQYRAGGYGGTDAAIEEAVALGWAGGLPLDQTYTGKPFSAMIDWARQGRLGKKTLFWHTGGLWNWVRAAHGNKEGAAH